MVAKISQNLSSSTLFHFTSQVDYLKAIFENGFQARYCYEKLLKKRLAYIAPIVCFCDIPLGNVKYHLSRYGGYGIGVSQGYLKDKGVTPLHYIHSKSPHVTITGSDSNLDSLRKNPFTPYLKQAWGYDPVFEEGTRKVVGRKQIKYLNEKEWRFSPRKTPIEFMKYKKIQELVDWKDSYNTTETIYQHLEIDDLSKIEYIILANKADVEFFIKFIDTLKSKKGFDRDLLISKILTQGMILRDF